MTLMKKQQEIQSLEKAIAYHKDLYYRGCPEIADHEYDAIETKLKKLDPDNPVLNLVGSRPISSKKVKHDKKMLSLDKTYVPEDLEKWVDGKTVVSTYKVDGVSCSLVYENERLILAKTRGDGKYGEDITDKIMWMEQIPKHIVSEVKNFEIRGELYCTEEDFFHLSETMESLGLEKPTSQRNIVAGLMGRKDHLNLARFLSFAAFEMITDSKFKKEWDKVTLLKVMGFQLPETELIKNSKQLKKVLDQTQEFMSFGDYQIDGLVITYNDASLHEELGYTAHHPRYKIAFKFQGESKTTKINEILWSVSRNGFLTPVADVRPVELSGAKISRVTLHNYGMVKQHNLKVGDEIEIIRSGEVIPKFLQTTKESKNDFEIPSRCPSCEKKVYIEDIRLVCKNPVCPDQIKESILNYIQKIGIDDLSIKRLEEMIKKGLVKEIPDLYKLSIEDFLTLDKTKETLAKKLYQSIQKSKSKDIKTFLSALGLTGGAYNKCEKIVDAGYDTIEKLLALTTEELVQVESFAEKSAVALISSLKSKEKLIKKLQKLGFQFKEVVIEDNPIKGKKICITGSLSSKRADVEKLIREYGGTMVSSVSKTTDYLLTNDTEPKSSKFKKALDLNVPIISEEKFRSLLK